MIDKRIYSELITSVELAKVELKSLNCEQDTSLNENIASVNIEVSLSDLSNKAEKLLVPIKFKVESKDTETSQSIFSIQFEYVLEYVLEITREFEDIYFQEFAQKNVPVNAWPYARELVSAISTRMGYPALFIPLYKSEFVR